MKKKFTSKPKVVETKISTIKAYLQPDDQFNPLLASDQELIDNGFPTRPDEHTSPQAFTHWKKHVTRKSERIIPDLEKTNRQHGPAIRRPNTSRLIANVAENSGNWSGIVIEDTNNPWNVPSTSISGQWIVPPPSCVAMSNGAYYCSQWVGIDGWNSPDVFQCGVSTDITCPNQPNTFFWIEWYPDYAISVNNLPVSAGDTVSVVVFINQAGEYLFTLENVTNNQSTTMQIQPPAGTQLVGNCVEWIVESPTVGGTKAALTNYGSVLISGSASYSTPNTTTYYPGFAPTGTLYEVTMVDNNGVAISQPSIVGSGNLSKVLCTCELPTSTT